MLGVVDDNDPVLVVGLVSALQREGFIVAVREGLDVLKALRVLVPVSGLDSVVIALELIGTAGFFVKSFEDKYVELEVLKVISDFDVDRLVEGGSVLRHHVGFVEVAEDQEVVLLEDDTVQDLHHV